MHFNRFRRGVREPMNDANSAMTNQICDDISYRKKRYTRTRSIMFSYSIQQHNPAVDAWLTVWKYAIES